MKYKTVISSIVLVVFSFILASCGEAVEPRTSAPVEGQKATAAMARIEQGDIDSISALIIEKLQAGRPDLNIDKVEASPIAGLYSVHISNGPVLYATADGKHFVVGDLYQVRAGGFVNLAEQSREGERAAKMAKVNTEDMIIFSPQQPAKAAITVFTDVDCYYCQKLHQEMADLHRLGIEVRYLAYPRAGIGSASYDKITSAWCADDRQEAMDKLKNRKSIEINVCADNPVQKQFILGQQVGVTGTPALITSSGQLLPGYMPALKLARALGVDVDPALAAELEQKL